MLSLKKIKICLIPLQIRYQYHIFNNVKKKNIILLILLNKIAVLKINHIRWTIAIVVAVVAVVEVEVIVVLASIVAVVIVVVMMMRMKIMFYIKKELQGQHKE